ncbi:uncharacterized protein LOC116197144 isoform X2 [Punica granatum]|uniref:Uncharacterized protein LOC116197144 isoform X2 n=1 Tax=Punica granatum TaxID=22663 RepID=A0A6P8CKZ5_PUNGR|nr:uncharacterized protein LOC116197144 isoform X2 [Punica granatum]
MRWAHNTIPMASSRTASMIFLSFALLVFSTFERASCAAAFTNATCIEREREALLEFKRGLVDKSNLLSSWVGDDCCSWKGVRCSKLTGRVLKLDLRSPCVVPFYFGDVLLDQFLGHGNCTLTGKDESYACWLYSGMAPGFATGFLGVCCSLYFKHSWRQSFFLWSDKIITQLLVMVEIKLQKVTRKCKMNPIR